jgi:hypothetical protein
VNQLAPRPSFVVAAIVASVLALFGDVARATPIEALTCGDPLLSGVVSLLWHGPGSNPTAPIEGLKTQIPIAGTATAADKCLAIQAVIGQIPTDRVASVYLERHSVWWPVIIHLAF